MGSFQSNIHTPTDIQTSTASTDSDHTNGQQLYQRTATVSAIMSTSRESVALKKCNQSKAKLSKNQSQLHLPCSSSLASATTDETSDKIVQPALPTPTLKVEAEEVSLIKTPVAKIDYFKLKPASKKKRTDDNCESLFIEDFSENRITRQISSKIDHPQSHRIA